MKPADFVDELWNTGVIDEYVVARVLGVRLPEDYDADLEVTDDAVTLVVHAEGSTDG